MNLTDVNEYAITTISDANAAANTVLENAANGTLVGITAFASDADGTDVIRYSLTNTASGRFAIDATTGIVTVADGTLLDREISASYNIIVQASSTDGSFSTQSFTINLIDVNDTPPVITPGQQFSVSELATAGTVVGNVAATDADATGSLQNWIISSGNVDNIFSINPATGRITVTDVSLLNYESTASYTLTLTVADGNSTSAPQTITINIVDENEAPVLNPAPVLSINENTANGTLVGTITGSDVDSGDMLRYSILSSGPVAPFSIDAVTGQIRVLDSSLLNFEAVTTVTLRVEIRDAAGLTDIQVVTIRINDVNETPNDIVLAGMSVQENSAGGTFVGSLSGSDPDAGDSLTFSLINSAGGRFTIDAGTNTLRVANGASLNFEVNPTHIIAVRTTDTAGHYYDKSFTITIINVNDAPVAVADQYVTTQLTALHATSANGVLTNDHDEDGSRLSVIVVNGPVDGTLAMSADGTFYYTPTTVFTGTDSFTYQVTDGQLNSSIVTVTINVLQTISAGSGANSGNTGSTGSGSSSGTTTGSGGGTTTGGSPTNNGGTSVNHTDGTATTAIPVTVASAGRTQGLGLETIVEALEESLKESRADQVNADAGQASQLASMVIAGLTGEYQQPASAERRSGLVSVGSAARFATSLFGGTVAVVPTDAIVSFSQFIFDQSRHAEQQTNTRESEITSGKIFVGSTAVVSTSISVGYVIWILRGGSLLTAFVSALPTWSSFDPLPVLQSFDKHNDDDDDTFLSIATRKAVEAVRNVVK